jgi:hypothetical protein
VNTNPRHWHVYTAMKTNPSTFNVEFNKPLYYPTSYLKKSTAF